MKNEPQGWWLGFVTSPTKRDYSSRAFIHWSGDVIVLTWLPPSRYSRSKRAPLQGTPRTQSQPKERAGGVCEILEWAPRFRCYSSFCECFQEKVGKSSESLSSSTPLTRHSFPHSSTPTPPPHHPITVSNPICYPNTCSIYVVSTGPSRPLLLALLIIIIKKITIITHNERLKMLLLKGMCLKKSVKWCHGSVTKVFRCGQLVV